MTGGGGGGECGYHRFVGDDFHKCPSIDHLFTWVWIWTWICSTCRLRLDPERRSLVLDDGTEVFFDKCLLATAGKPRQFYVLDSEKVSHPCGDIHDM